MVTGHGSGDLCARSTEGVSGSDSNAAAMTVPMVTRNFGWLLRGTEEKRGEWGWTASDKQQRRGSL
jgi:hypothetical protein